MTGDLKTCKLLISFGLGRASDEPQTRHIGDVDPMLIKEEQFTETQHNVFHNVSEQFESWTQELQHLKPRQAYVRTEGRPAIKYAQPRSPRRRSNLIAWPKSW